MLRKVLVKKLLQISKGNISGFLLIPNGFAPVKGKKSLDFTNTSLFFL